MSETEPRLTGTLRAKKLRAKRRTVPWPSSMRDPRRRLAVLTGAALIVGAACGAGITAAATPSATETAEYQKLEGRLDETVAAKNEAIEEQQDEISDLRIEKGKLENAAGDVAVQQAAADSREAELAAREAALTSAEAAKKASEFGNGVHIVGTDVTAGTYSISSSSDCYYAWMTGTGSDSDIIDNNIVSGPTTVTLRDGDVFETSRCGTWSKVG